MGFLNKIGKIIKAPIKVLEKVISPVSMIPGVGKVLGKVASPVSMIPGTAGKVLGGIAGINPLVKGQIAGITPGGVKGNPIVGGVKIPMQGLMEKSKSNPIVDGVNKPKVKVVDPDFNIFRKKKIVPMKRGGLVGSASSRAEGAMKKGGSSASSRADGIAQRGKTRGRMV